MVVGVLASDLLDLSAKDRFFSLRLTESVLELAYLLSDTNTIILVIAIVLVIILVLWMSSSRFRGLLVSFVVLRGLGRLIRFHSPTVPLPRHLRNFEVRS